MATSPPEVRAGLEVVTAAATVQIAAATIDVPADDLTSAALEVVRDLVPGLYDAAGALAVAWYDELRDEAGPSFTYDPTIISEPNTDWIDREVERLARQLESQIEADVNAIADRLVAEAEALAQKEIARGFRDTIDGNARRDPLAIGWSRHTRDGACPFCRFLARDSAVYRTERSARFAAHTDCHCLARPEFKGGSHGPEADVLQYVASERKRSAEERRKLREYLRTNYPETDREQSGSSNAPRPTSPRRDVDAGRSVEQLRTTLADLERSLELFDSSGTRARISELRRKIAERQRG